MHRLTRASGVFLLVFLLTWASAIVYDFVTETEAHSAALVVVYLLWFVLVRIFGAYKSKRKAAR